MKKYQVTLILMIVELICGGYFFNTQPLLTCYASFVAGGLLIFALMEWRKQA